MGLGHQVRDTVKRAFGICWDMFRNTVTSSWDVGTAYKIPKTPDIPPGPARRVCLTVKRSFG